MTAGPRDARHHLSTRPDAAGPDTSPRQRNGVAPRLESVGWSAAVYVGSRIVLLLVAVAMMVVTHRPLGTEMSMFDGRWYLRLAGHGYPNRPLRTQSTLGFFPLYPLIVRGVSILLSCSLLTAGLTVSFTGGLVAAVLVGQLTELWWGPRTARRAVVSFCLFPGSIVFSMSYAECVTIPLAVGCLLALRARRWGLAGTFAGFATAAEPVALVLIPVCLAVALRHLQSSGWRTRSGLHALLAPLIAPSGLAGFAVFLWLWTGTPFAYLTAQRYGWSQQADPLALLTQPAVRHVLHHPTTVSDYLTNLNLWNGVLGAALLVVALIALTGVRREMSPGALLWAFGVGAFTLWSVRTPPNARMLLAAFPTVVVWSRRLPHAFSVFAATETMVLVAASAVTYAGLMRP